MDPASLALGIAGLLPLITKAIRCAKEYSDAVRTAKDAISALISELEALQFSVGNLQQFLKCNTLADDNVTFRQTSVLLSCFKACDAKLRSLCRKLGQEDGERRSRYLWPFSEKEHQKTVQELRNFATWMHLALTVDGCRLLSQTSDDVLKLLGQQLEHFKAIQSLEETVTQISSTVKGQRRLLEDSLANDARKQILDWISTTRYYQKHQALQESRTRNAGDWILQSANFIRWRDGSGQSDKVLLCEGFQGSGKTNLASIMIDNLLSPAQSPRQAVGYFYFDHQDQSSQLPATVLSCILRQLLDQQRGIPEAVSRVYKSVGSKGGLPQFECASLIAEVTKDLGRVYLVLDALDECAPEHRASLLQILSQLSRVPGLRLLVTSRPHIREVTTAFTHFVCLKIVARDEDIRLYIRQELSRNGIHDMCDAEFGRELIQKLTQGADGMFLLPVLQLRTILKEPTVGEMEDSLNNLSNNLTEAFKETIGRIRSFPASRARLGMETLMYLTHAARTLNVDELRDILSVHPNHRHINAKYRPTEKMILECCQGLVTVDARTGDVRTCHYSVKEYLLGNSHRLFPRAESAMATKCLRYLMLEDFSTGPWEEKEDIQSRTQDHPFLPYAAHFWGRHVKLSGEDQEVQAALDEFFTSTRATATANQIRQYNMGYRPEYWTPEECLSFTPLHLAAREGLAQTIEGLLRTGRFEVNVCTRQGATSIIHAAANGHVDIVRMLLQRGADPYLSNWYGNALHCAIEGDRASTVRELIVGWGMNWNGTDGYGGDYLDCVLSRDSAEALETLVDVGVDIRRPATGARGWVGETVGLELFLVACDSGSLRIVQLMIERGWVGVNKRFAGGPTALHTAARSGRLAIVQRLIELGADTSVKDDHGHTALEILQWLYPSRALDVSK